MEPDDGKIGMFENKNKGTEMAEIEYLGFIITEVEPNEFEIKEPPVLTCPVAWVRLGDWGLSGGQSYLGGATLKEAEETIDDLLAYLASIIEVEYRDFKVAYPTYEPKINVEAYIGLEITPEFDRGDTVMDKDNYRELIDAFLIAEEEERQFREDVGEVDWDEEDEDMWEAEAERSD